MDIEDEINKLDLDLSQFKGPPDTDADFEKALLDWRSLSRGTNDDIYKVKELFTSLLVKCPDAPAFTGIVTMPNVVMLMIFCFKIGRRYEQVKAK